MEDRIARIMPLLDPLRRFCRGHVEGDGGRAAEEMLSCLETIWPDVPQTSLPSAREDSRGADDLCLTVIHDIGEVAGVLLAADDAAREELAWSRANLILDLRRYLQLVGRRS